MELLGPAASHVGLEIRLVTRTARHLPVLGDYAIEFRDDMAWIQGARFNCEQRSIGRGKRDSLRELGGSESGFRAVPRQLTGKSLCSGFSVRPHEQIGRRQAVLQAARPFVDLRHKCPWEQSPAVDRVMGETCADGDHEVGFEKQFASY